MEPVVPKRKPNPKRLEKTLFVNHKEDQALEKRLESISLNSRLRMMELDRERINLKNEFRMSKRRKMPDVKPRSPSPDVFRMSRQTSTALDPVNSYLLREYTKVGEVIPSILMSLAAKEEAKSQFVPPQPAPDVEAKPFEEPDLAKILHLVRNVKKMRKDMALSKRLEGNRTKVNFNDLMRDFEEKEKAGGPSEDFTDGTCVLLRRKISKMRRESFPIGDKKHEPSDGYMHGKRHSVGSLRGNELCPQLPGLGARSMTTLGMPGRQKTDMTSYRMGQIAEEDELITRTKVSRELENYDKIRGRIGTFMDEFEANRLPPLTK